MTRAEAVARIAKTPAYKIVMSRPEDRDCLYKKIVIEEKADFFQISKYTKTQVFHENVAGDEVAEKFTQLCACFLQVNAFSEVIDYELTVTKSGRATLKSHVVNPDAPLPISLPHDREKNYLIKDGEFCEPLYDMGVMTADGRVKSPMHAKFRQINRFLEIINDEISGKQKSSYRIIDFGCGKSYLTFIVYYYFTRNLGLNAEIVGVDLKKDVIEACEHRAKKYGYTGLKFACADINGFEAPFRPDIVMSLHACDTATDYALCNAVKWGAETIFSVPCCQHELNSQLKSVDLLSRYGIIKERFCALATDAVRAETLEICGYKTQVLEYIDFEDTPKNILIRAVKRQFTADSVKERAERDIKEITERYGFRPKICELLGDYGK
ncbi:MAG: SAM-dependent methyltransferase [Clostridia bacterium]|nr:SAM-dependent methyltransferase [Clostridia bacterium]